MAYPPPLKSSKFTFFMSISERKIIKDAEMHYFRLQLAKKIVGVDPNNISHIHFSSEGGVHAKKVAPLSYALP